MNNRYQAEYQSKLRTAEQAVQVVNSGDVVLIGEFIQFPEALEAALAERVDELWDVNIRAVSAGRPLKTVQADPTREHFIYDDWHFGAVARSL
ncbi:MAG: butyryl-CoA:acetate CoA-transferase, partial [Syntrophomonadaceae bacterium]|nr:butyryl-CoA:acetate CoA-transferase [Syntrophomonadaceae bacterium]